MMQLAVAQVQRRLRVLQFLQLSMEVFVEDLLAAIHVLSAEGPNWGGS
jgi:hypothetical protein